MPTASSATCTAVSGPAPATTSPPPGITVPTTRTSLLDPLASWGVFFGTTWRIERDRETARLAHQAYVELITRKAALEFEERDDVLTEIYDSWYALFGEIRRLTRELDADGIARNADLRQLHDLLVAVLNQGLRPHLTRWHARFRRWYTAEADGRPEASPQEIQRAYPEYDELVASLRMANQLLIELAAELKKLGHGEGGP